MVFKIKIIIYIAGGYLAGTLAIIPGTEVWLSLVTGKPHSLYSRRVFERTTRKKETFCSAAPE